MKWNKFNTENKSRCTIDVKKRYDLCGISIKLSKGFVKLIEGTIEHIKRNKRIYKRFIVYIAFCLSLYSVHDIVRIIESFDYAMFMQQVNSMPRDILINNILRVLKCIAYWIIMLLTLKDIIVNVFTVKENV